MELTATIATLRLAETFVISRESRDEEEVVQVELRHDGLVGHGEAAPLERYDEDPAAAVAFLEEAGAAALGADPFALEEIEARLGETPGQNAAKAALDGALHDLQGKLLGIPAWRLLGVPRTGPPTSWTVWLGDPDDMARRAEKVAGRFERLKLKLGGGDGLDVERVRAVRGVTELPLMVDVNEWWSLDEALDALEQLAALGVEYCEQPLPAGAEDARTLKERSPLPIYVDEDCHRLDSVAALRRDRARDQHQAREVGRDPGGDPDDPCRASARARGDARLHGRVGARNRRRLPRGAALRSRRPRRQSAARRRSVVWSRVSRRGAGAFRAAGARCPPRLSGC